MIIEDKYFNILHTIIYDKRCKMAGILSSIQITRYIRSGYGISFCAYMNGLNPNHSIYVEDFEKGNVVFLIPFWKREYDKELDEIGAKNTQKIKDFFGDKFREDMIMRISEEERQEEIRKWEAVTIGFENWQSYLRDKNGGPCCPL